MSLSRASELNRGFDARLSIFFIAMSDLSVEPARGSPILVPGLVHLPGFYKSHSLAPNHLIDWGVKETKFDKKRGSLKLIDNLIGQYNRA